MIYVRTTVAALLIGLLSPAIAKPQKALSVVEARRMAVEFNRQYLTAQEDVVKAGADVAVARAGALPTLDLSGSYDRNFKIPSFFVQADGQAMEFKTGYKNTYGLGLTLNQTLWQGGKVWSAWAIARQYRKYAAAGADQVRSLVIYQTDSLFYAAILARSGLDALQKSHDAAVENLSVVEKRHSQGLVSDFELLRARVEKLNLEPQILSAESSVRLAEKRLKSFLGLDLEESLELLEDPADTALGNVPSLDELYQLALDERPEIKQAELAVDMRNKAVKVARADYYPSLNAIASYDWQAQSDAFTLNENKSESWTAGLRLSFPIFSGGKTRGAVTQAKADQRTARLQESQQRDDVRLQVEAAYDRLLQTKEALDIQKNTIAQAEEGLKIADLRYESGVGTLLEVLSARASLTDARRIQAEAIFAFREAKAQLKLTTTYDVDNQE